MDLKSLSKLVEINGTSGNEKNVAKYLEKTYAINVIYVKIDSNGSVDYKDLEQILESKQHINTKNTHEELIEIGFFTKYKSYILEIKII